VGCMHLVKNLAANRIESRSLGLQNHPILERRSQPKTASKIPASSETGPGKLLERFWRTGLWMKVGTTSGQCPPFCLA
jgi:hypothetical protein